MQVFFLGGGDPYSIPYIFNLENKHYIYSSFKHNLLYFVTHSMYQLSFLCLSLFLSCAIMCSLFWVGDPTMCLEYPIKSGTPSELDEVHKSQCLHISPLRSPSFQSLYFMLSKQHLKQDFRLYFPMEYHFFKKTEKRL